MTTYSWTASPAAPGSRSVTATNNASLTSVGATFTPTADDSGPTGGSISYTNGAVSGGTVAVTFTGLTVTGGSNPTSTVTSTAVARITTGASYGFEEGAGTTAADGAGNGNPLTLQSGAGWTAGKVGSKALNLTGSSTSWASSTGPVIDTSKSFTVAGWVKFADLGGFQTIASQDGGSVSPFYLQKRSEGVFAFTIHNSDDTTGINGSSAGVSPRVGTWYHLAGVYDATAHIATLYVNGVPQAALTGASPFGSTGAAAVGRAKYGGGNVDFVNGAVDDVRFLGRALSASEVAALAAG